MHGSAPNPPHINNASSIRATYSDWCRLGRHVWCGKNSAWRIVPLGRAKPPRGIMRYASLLPLQRHRVGHIRPDVVRLWRNCKRNNVAPMPTIKRLHLVITLEEARLCTIMVIEFSLRGTCADIGNRQHCRPLLKRCCQDA